MITKLASREDTMHALKAYKRYLEELEFSKFMIERLANQGDHDAMGKVWDADREGAFDVAHPIKINYDFRKLRNVEYKYETRLPNGDIVRVY